MSAIVCGPPPRCTGKGNCPLPGHAEAAQPHEECRSCHAVCDRAWTYPLANDGPPALKMQLLDRASAGNPKGNLAVARDNGGKLRYRYLSKGEEPRAGEIRGWSHFASCPDAEKWRSGRGDSRREDGAR